MAIRRTKVTVTAAGSAGAAVGSARTTEIVAGRVHAVHLDYSASAPATTDVTITEGNESPAVPVLTVTDNATDGWYWPMAQAVNGLGAAITGQGAQIVTADYLLVSVAGANAADTVTATIIWDDGR